ncbi:hypothetical protein FRB97_000328 [Tulasnella sp. 331]|nr:hypothetical protein FRB97_000328 [Tulasnella sp. 331]
MFGLLSGCSHPFCLTCLRDWRASSKKDQGLIESNVIKTCPLCRAESNFITPASQFFAQDDPKKTIIIEAYKRSMARVPCKYFLRSPSHKRFCPYGDDCFYKHEDENGQLHKFDSGASTLLPAFKARQARESRQRARRRRANDLGLSYGSDGSDPLDILGDAIDGLPGGESAGLAAALELIRSGVSPREAWSSLYDAIGGDEDDDYEDEWHDQDRSDQEWDIEDLVEAFEAGMGW